MRENPNRTKGPSPIEKDKVLGFKIAGRAAKPIIRRPGFRNPKAAKSNRDRVSQPK